MDLFGTELFDFVTRHYTEVIASIQQSGKNVEVFVVNNANHNRSTKDRKEEKYYLTTYGIYTVIKERLKQFNVDVNILKDNVSAFERDNINIIMQHGHLDTVKKKPHELAWSLGLNPKNHTVAINSHFHSAVIEDAGKGITRMQTPAIKSPDGHSRENLYNSEKGYITFSRNEVNSVDVKLNLIVTGKQIGRAHV